MLNTNDLNRIRKRVLIELTTSFLPVTFGVVSIASIAYVKKARYLEQGDQNFPSFPDLFNLLLGNPLPVSPPGVNHLLLLWWCSFSIVLAIFAQPYSFGRGLHRAAWAMLMISVYLLNATALIDLANDSPIFRSDLSNFLITFLVVLLASGLVAKAMIGAQLAAQAQADLKSTSGRDPNQGGRMNLKRLLESSDQGPTNLTPSQTTTVARLVAAVKGDPNLGGGNVVQLVGQWGSGKSTILNRFRADYLNGFDRGKKPVIAKVHVWRHEDDKDLHRAMAEEIIGAHLAAHRLPGLGVTWLRIPSTLLIARHLRSITVSMSVSMRRMDAEASTPVEVPKLFAQRSLNFFLLQRPTVVLIDEIDRATPSVAQSVLTLVRRSLDVPGTTSVLAYAEAIVRYKTMNPLSTLLPDIRSSVEALLSIQVGPPSPEDLKDKELLRKSDDQSGTWFDQSDWLRREWLFAHSFDGPESHGINVEDFYRTVEQKYLSSNVVAVRPLSLFVAAGLKGNTYIHEIYSMLRSNDIAIRVAQWELVECAARHAQPRHECLFELANRIAITLDRYRIDYLYQCYASDSTRLNLNFGLPHPVRPVWFHSFDGFAEHASSPDFVPIVDASEEVHAGHRTLLNRQAPIRRVVAAWIRDVDEAIESNISSEELAARMAYSVIRISVDGLIRHASPNFRIEDQGWDTAARTDE